MANKRGQSVPINDFNPRAKPDLGNGAIARIDGSDAAATAKAFGGLADQAGKFADRAAILEGRRAGAVAGNDPSFRPSGSATLRGAAEDEAGVSSYLNNVDAKLRNSMTMAFQEHQNDPAALKSAFDGIKATMTDPENGDIFPEVAASFNASFERLRLPFQIKALDNLQGRQRDEARATAVTAQSAGETLREQVIRAAPQAPATRQAVEATLAEDEVRDNRLVTSEALTAEQAAARRIKRRRDAEATLFEATGDTLTSPDAVATYRKSVQQDFSAKKTKLDADGFTRVDAALAQREQQLRARGSAERSTVSGTFDQIVKQYSEGSTPNPQEVAALRQRAASIPDGALLTENFDRKLLIASVARVSKPAELDDMADAITRTARENKVGLTSDEGERVGFLRSLATTKRAKLAADPVAYARQQGIIEAAPLVVPTADADAAVSRQIVPRIAAARAAAQAQGGDVRYLTNDDKAMLKTVADAGGDRALAMVKGLVEGAGADAPALLREIGGDLPEMAKVGDLLVNGGPGSDRTAREITKAIELRQVKDAKIPTVPKNAAELMRGELGDAYLNSAQAQAQVMASAKAIYEARAFGKITDPNGSEARDLYKEALHAASGAGKQGDVAYGGVTNYRPGYVYNYKVAIPSNVRADRFRDVMGAIRDEDLGGATDPSGKPISARDVRGAIPVRVRGGYAFSLDDPREANPRFLGKPGAPLVLDIDGLGGELRKRVPGAYLGGDR